MADTDSVTSEPRHVSIPLPRQLWIGVPTSVLVIVAMAVSGKPADKEGDEDEPLPVQTVVVTDSYVELQGFTTVTRTKLDTDLRVKVAIVNRLCGLTDSQKQALALAGRGDIKRWFDRFEENQAQLRLVGNDRNKIRALGEENRLLMRMCDNQPALRNDGTLFVKSLEKFLASEQPTKYQAIRDVLRVGGLVKMRQRGLENLLEIDLTRTTFADDDLAHLRQLRGINSLILAYTPVTDTGLAHLKELTELREIWLGNTQLTDAGLAHLKGLTKLERVWLDNAKVTDAGLVHLKELTSLYGLSLTHTQTTDAGLTNLNGLTKLKWLFLDDTKVTDAGAAELHRALPGLRIHW